MSEYNLYGMFIETFDTFFASVSIDNLVPRPIEFTFRGKLINDLINIFPRGSIKSRNTLSLLLFNHRYELLKNFFGLRLFTIPAHSTLFKILNNIRDLTTNAFKEITKYDITLSELIIIKQKASQIIENFIDKHTTDSEPEIISRGYMEYLFNAEFKKYTKGSLDWLQGISGALELDGYNKRLGIAFEYNGPQHYSLEFYKNVYKLSKEVALKRLERQQQNDRIKKELCEKRGITLIVIPFDIEYKDMQEYIVTEYERLTHKNAPKKEYKSYTDILSLLLKKL